MALKRTARRKITDQQANHGTGVASKSGAQVKSNHGFHEVNVEFIPLHAAKGTEHRFSHHSGMGPWTIPEQRERQEETSPTNPQLENFELAADGSGVGRKKPVLNARRVADDGKKTQWILLAMKKAKG